MWEKRYLVSCIRNRSLSPDTTTILWRSLTPKPNIDVSDDDCRDQLRMDRATFHKLCYMLQSVGGLKTSRRVTVTEKVAMFLSVLAHHTKNRCVKFQFKRSGQTVSKHFHAVLHCVLRMQSLFLVKPHPVTEDSTDVRWQKFPPLIT
ncbi:hypothetical protein ACS0TY_026130 [Phlomoides rotata]